jgi:hypothetical protein
MFPPLAMENFPSVTPTGIHPETLGLAAQCLNHYATAGTKTIFITINSVTLQHFNDFKIRVADVYINRNRYKLAV